jgi:hypothetical protein
LFELEIKRIKHVAPIRSLAGSQTAGSKNPLLKGDLVQTLDPGDPVNKTRIKISKGNLWGIKEPLINPASMAQWWH